MCYSFMPKQSRRAEEAGREEITTRSRSAAAPEPAPADEPAVVARQSAHRSYAGFMGALKKLWAKRKEEQSA